MQRRLSSILAAVVLGITACGAPSEKDSIAAATTELAKGNAKSAIVHSKSALQKNPQSGEARFLLGKALFLTGSVGGALEELEKARSSNFDDNQVLPLLARVQLASGQSAKVAERFSETALSDPKAAAELRAQVAVALFQLGRFEHSSTQVETALKLDPKNEVARLQGATLAAKRARFDEALTRVDQLLADNPKNAAAWTFKGEFLWLAKSNVEGAVDAFRQALKAEPDWMNAHAGLLLLARTRNDVPAFRSQVAELKKVAPNALFTRTYETELALLDNDLERARAGVQELLRAAPQAPHVLWLAGSVALRTGAVAQARTYFSQAVQLNPGDAVSRRWLAIVLLRSGQAAEALATLKPLLDRPGPSPDILEVAAQAHLQNGDAATAEAYYTRAAQARPDDPKARVALLVMRLNRGDVAGGLAALESLAASDAGTEADMALVSLYVARNSTDEALKAAERLQRKTPNDVTPYLLRGRILARRGDAVAARASLEKALAIDPNHFAAVAEIGMLDLSENKIDAARKRYEDLLVREPGNQRAMLALADVQHRAGTGVEQVEALVRRAITANPFDPAAKVALVDYRLHRRQTKEALAAAHEAVAALPNDPVVQEALGRALLASGDSQQALSTFRKVADAPGTPREISLRVARIYAGMRNHDAAAEVLRKVLKGSPDLVEAQQALLELELARNRLPQAVEVAKLAQKHRPTESVGYMMEARVAAKQRRWDAAIAAGKEALARERSSNVAIHMHGIYMAAGRRAEADRFADAWRRERPNDVHLVAHLGSVALAERNLPAAEAQYRTAVALVPDSAPMLNNLAWVLVLQSKSEAVAVAEKATRLAPNQPAYMDTLAQALRTDKKPASALEWARKAVAGAPDKPQYRLNLARLLIESGERAQARSELETLSKLGGRFAAHAEVTRLLGML